jgi:hypothetical protein
MLLLVTVPANSMGILYIQWTLSQPAPRLNTVIENGKKKINNYFDTLFS